MTTNKTPDERTTVREPGRATVRLVFAGVAANAATQFAIQAWMSYRFAHDVWAIPQALCVGIICALDLFAGVLMAITYQLRTAKWHTRAYDWLVFAAGVGAELFAAELYGAKEEWAIPVRVFAALPALFLAASLHGLIIWRNYSAVQPTVIAPARTTRPPVPDAQPETVPAPAKTKARAQKVGATPKPSGRAGNPNRMAAVNRALAGEDTRVIASDLGVTRRAVQLWVQKAERPRPAIGAFNLSDPQPINGYSFDTEAEAQGN